MIPPSLWVSHDTHLRRKHACEGFHSHFAESFKSPHSNVFEFVDKLDKKIRHRTEERLRSISASIPREPPKEDRLRQKQRDEILQQYQEKTITTLEYIGRVAYSMLYIIF
ncbi:hypothetical protein RRG08_035797 [Elysia crispata]|uniref:Uncharacterized protein n=1 Tax=Elysia crispata TaxID=231223 RepID=A0AAE0ZLR2_9GAST|nr:hypothetical protein RRG08_035797 [Elysia crispata]